MGSVIIFHPPCVPAMAAAIRVPLHEAQAEQQRVKKNIQAAITQMNTKPERFAVGQGAGW